MSSLHFIVIPAKAGISPVRIGADGEMPASAGVTEYGA
jgi:hypothetical protein